MSSQPFYEKIEAYLNGTLSEAETRAFEKRLESDPELAQELRLFQNIDTALRDKPALEFQEIVRSEGAAFLQKQEAAPEQREATQWPRRYWIIAISLLALILLIFFLWKMQAVPLSGEELYAQNFETYPINQSIRSDGGANPEFSAGLAQYQARNFTGAAQAFQQLAAVDDQDMVLAFCLGNSYLNLNPPNFDLATQEFQKIIDNGTSIYVPKAKWYLALILLKNEKIKEAESLLREVAGSGDSYGARAQNLLKLLEF